MDFNKLKPVIVEWEDAGTIRDFDPEFSFKPFSCKEIGFVLSHNKDRLLIVTGISYEEKRLDITAIPNGCIKKIRRLYEIPRKNK